MPSPSLHTLSAIIITRNEAADIEECLKSLGDLPRQVVVVDDFSSDGTPEIARRLGAELHSRRWDGFGAQKQFALEQARGEWVLNVDADERLTPELREEIGSLLSSGPHENAYEIPFHLYFMGRRLRFGGCGGETHVRLFRKSGASYPARRVHEGVTVRPPVGRLRHPVLHVSYRDMTEYLDKCNRYTSLLARARWESGGRARPWDVLRLPLGFFRDYVLRLGFLDGGPGFVYAALGAYYSWMKFLKLRDLEREAS